jgi:hypothetical protein
MNEIWIFINEILSDFRNCFARKRAFELFSLLILATIIREDLYGLTSIVRTFNADQNMYYSALSFLNSTSWDLAVVYLKWFSVLRKSNMMMRDENGRAFIIGDASKQPKESKFAPSVKKIFQESADSSKGQFKMEYFLVA